MAEHGKEYHEQLQEAVRNKLVLTEEQKETMKNPISHHEIERALKLSENNKAASIDRLTYELWKQLLKDEYHKIKTQVIQETPKVLEILKVLFNDIEEYGTNNGSNLAEGWLCLIYKKGD
ncbi:hypothetical protein BDN71DRAFT_1512409 [Pleurotus eryngii]|uniref:Uncharacterized protein n=1 Tax=Pleurotus eryngii TaxID=5323 RepID=A0A9P6D312_PLEER|nr:hypothetical protein BDN71DRAFT_1512409 [Pleurotus eryngii]